MPVPVVHFVHIIIFMPGSQGVAPDFVQAARAFISPFPLALAHAACVKSLIWEIFAAGKRLNKSFK
jgi:hypothetical protein